MAAAAPVRPDPARSDDAGTLVSYAIANGLDGTGSLVGAFVATLGQVLWWNALPNGPRASFCNAWAGHLLRPRAFRARVRADLGTVFGLLADGALTPDEQAVTLRAVARRVGIAAPSIYAHFADRQAILLALVRDAFAELGRELSAADAAAGPDPEQRLRAACTA